MLRNLYFVTIVMITVQFPLYRDQFMQLSVFRNDFVVKNRSPQRPDFQVWNCRRAAYEFRLKKKSVNYIEQQSKVVSIQAKLLHKP